MLEGRGRKWVEARLEEALAKYGTRTKDFFSVVQMKMKLKDGSEEDRWVAYCSDLEGLKKYIRKERRIGENGESLYGYRFMAIAL